MINQIITRKLTILFALLTLSIGAWAQDTESDNLPTPESNQIFYRSSDHQKITPNNANAFGAAYNDAQSTYDTEADYGVITFDGNITTIGEWAFTRNTTLTAVVWPSTVTSIGQDAFNGCTNLSSVNLQEGITGIGEGAFAGCAGMEELTIPSTVTSIGNDAFKDCSDVTSVTFLAYVVVNNAFGSVGTAESPVALKLPSTWLASDKPVDSATPWHGGYFNCEYTDPIKEFLGEMGEPCIDCPSIEVTKGDKTVKLYNPEKVEFGKE